ncbi:Uncharacterised protein [Citrobacter koseri]|uniref:Uncharacterized protein n=1 Tax=Citrobacter koseri TaxID=545 RepID=A0A2X2VF27_CITKO|nr:Uncharacterised protein [Citrobacter koseri]
MQRYALVGEMVQFLLRTNLIGWTRFGTLAIKELHVWYKAGGIDADAVDEYMDLELRRMLSDRFLMLDTIVD